MKNLFTILILAISGFLKSQVNLVPNPSFEMLDSCPYNQQQVHFASPWQDFCASPDLYNTCASTFNNTVPANWTGYQWPRTGNGYAGFSLYNFYNNSNPEVREYIATTLIDSLRIGKTYCVEFYVSKPNYSYFAVNRVGLYFTTTAMIPDNQGDTIDVQPQIEWDSSQMLLDTANWIRVAGTYLANGGEMFIAIGNFYSDSETDTIGQLGSYIWGYYYIDDVAIYELSDCNAGNDVSICYKDSVQLGSISTPNVLYEWTPSIGLSNPNISNPFASPDTSISYILKQTECDAISYDTIHVTVNRDCHSASSILIPTITIAAQEFFISGLESNSQLDIYDIRGRLIFASDDYQNDFRFMNEDQAMYIAVLTRANGEQICKKVCVIRY